MRLNKVKTHKGKKYLDDRSPKLEENDKAALIVRGPKANEMVTKALHEFYLLKKPLAQRLMRKNPIHPFEDDTMLCKFSHKFDHSLFVFGCSTKKRPNTLVFGRMFDHHMLDMMELQMLNFVPSAEFNANGVTLGSKPCVLLQGPLFESNETLQRMGNLMVDWFQGVKVETIRLQGLELVIALTAVSEEKVLLRVYKAELKKGQDSSSPRVELVERGPQIDFKVDRSKLASDELFRTALKKPKLTQKPKDKNVKYDTFGNKVAKVHTGRQQMDQIQKIGRASCRERVSR